MSEERLGLTLICPVARMADGNALAMVLAEGAADVETFRHAHWSRAGEVYAVAGLYARPSWIAMAQEPLVRPAWDSAEAIDMTAAGAAHGLLTIWSYDEGAAPPLPGPDRLLAILGLDPRAGAALAGLTYTLTSA